jgi:hypothetical protein
LMATLLLNSWEKDYNYCEEPIEYFVLSQHLLLFLYVVITRCIMNKRTFKKALIFLFCYGFPLEIFIGSIGAYQ